MRVAAVLERIRLPRQIAGEDLPVGPEPLAVLLGPIPALFEIADDLVRNLLEVILSVRVRLEIGNEVLRLVVILERRGLLALFVGKLRILFGCVVFVIGYCSS